MAEIGRVAAGDALLFAGFLLFLELASGAGLGLLRWAGSGLRGALARYSAGLLAGVPLLGTAFLGLALSGILYPSTIAGAVALACVPPLARGPRATLAGALSGFARAGWLPALALLAVAVPVFIPSLLPRVEHDAYQYHFAGPWAALANHRALLEAVPYSFSVPMPVEMAYLVPMTVGDDRACGWLVLALFLSAWGLFLALLPDDEKGWRGALVPVAFLLGAGVPGLLTNGKTDLAATGMFGAGAVLWTRRRWMSGAVLLGTAPAAKFVYAPLAAVFVAFNPPPVRLILPALGLIIAPLLPWMAKSALALGNPAFPMLTGLFPTLNWGEGNRRVFWKQTSELMDPAAATLAGVPGAWLKAMARTQPLALLAMCLFPVSARWAVVLAALVAGQLLTLALGQTQRYLMPAFFTALLLAPALRYAGRRRATRLAATALAVAATGWFWFRQVPPLFAGVRARDFATSRSVLRARDLTTYGEVTGWLKEHGVRRSLAIGQFITYRAPGRVFANGSVGETPLMWKVFRESSSLPGARKKLRQLGVTVAWYNFVSASMIRNYYVGSFIWTEEMLANYIAFERAYMPEAGRSFMSDFQNGGYYIYCLAARPLARKGPVDYLPGAETMLGSAIPLAQEGRLPEALAALEQVRRRWPEVRAVPGEMGFYRSRLGDWKAAYRLLKPLVDGGMLEQTLFPTFGASAIGMDRLDEADRWLNEALRRYPTHEQDIRTNLATLELRRALKAMSAGDLKGSERHLAGTGKWLDFVPHDPAGAPAQSRRRKLSSMKGMLADIAFARREYARARPLYEEALGLAPELPGAANWEQRVMMIREYEARGGAVR